MAQAARAAQERAETRAESMRLLAMLVMEKRKPSAPKGLRDFVFSLPARNADILE